MEREGNQMTSLHLWRNTLFYLREMEEIKKKEEFFYLNVNIITWIRVAAYGISLVPNCQLKCSGCPPKL